MEWLEAKQRLRQVGADVGIFRCLSVGSRQFLFNCAKRVNARRALDIGTYTGISAITLALAVGPDGHVDTVDIEDVNAPDGRWNYEHCPTGRPADMMAKAGIDWVSFHHCDAMEFIQSTDELWDITLIDSSKSEEGTYLELLTLLDRTLPGGVIVLDDVFPEGKPMNPGGFSAIGPWLALERLKIERPDLRIEYHSRAPDGSQFRMGVVWV